jgi:hypothetical protein
MAAGLMMAADAFEKLTVLGPEFIEGFMGKLDLGPITSMFSGGIDDAAKKGARAFGEQFAEKINTIASAVGKLAGVLGTVASHMDTISKVTGFASKTAEVGGKMLVGIAPSEQDTTGLVASGASLVDGIISGIFGKKSELEAAVLSLAGVVDTTFAAGIQAHSPSRLFAKHGVNIDRGLAMGIQAGAAAPINAMSGVTGGIASGAGMSAGLSSGKPKTSATSVTNNFSPTVKATNHIDGSKSPQATASAISAMSLDSIMGAMANSKVAAGASYG